MYLAGNIVAPNDVFVGNREILGTLTCYYPYFAVIAAGILYLVIRALEAWDESARRVEAEREARRAYPKGEEAQTPVSGALFRAVFTDSVEGPEIPMEGYGVSLPVCVFVCLFLFLGLGNLSELFRFTERTAVCWA